MENVIKKYAYFGVKIEIHDFFLIMYISHRNFGDFLNEWTLSYFE